MTMNPNEKPNLMPGHGRRFQLNARWYCAQGRPPYVSPEPQEEYMRRERELERQGLNYALVAVISFGLGVAAMWVVALLSMP